MIRLRGVRVHNLRNIDLDLPCGQLIAFTGVSGSGKSSLAHHAIFAEGQRRYLAGLSLRTRRAVAELIRPDLDSLDGLPPVVTVDQRRQRLGRRSRLVNLTELAHYLTVLFARIGRPHCPECGQIIASRTPKEIFDEIARFPEGAKAVLLAPITAETGGPTETLNKLAGEGFLRVRVDSELHEIGEVPPFAPKSSPRIEVAIDRIRIKPELSGRFEESIQLALREGDGTCILSVNEPDGWTDHRFSSKLACANCGAEYPPLEPHHFNPNSHHGACSDCEGLGTEPESEDNKVAPRSVTCSTCDGTGFSPLPRAVTIDQTSYPELLNRSVTEVSAWVDNLAATATDATGPAEHAAVLDRLIDPLARRLRSLERIGLGYLHLNRPSRSLSGGEYQRARLAASLGSGLTGLCYILDEPSAGLHRDDLGRLTDCLTELVRNRNTVIVVDHEPTLWKLADLIVDLGPDGGESGGELVAVGSPTELTEHPERFPNSRTAAVLSGQVSGTCPARTTSTDKSGDRLTLFGARLHNLREVDAEFRAEALNVVTGVSGSGKSTLVIETLVPAMRAVLGRKPIPKELAERIEGGERFERLRVVDGSPLGRSGRSNPATAVGIWDAIRSLFARTREAKIRGFSASRFSFNSRGGRCEHCLGRGTEAIETEFLPEVEQPCPVCGGSRFNRPTLAIRYRGRSVADVLAMRVQEAAVFFENITTIRLPLETLDRLGLGYLTLGQPAPTLSGGEAQRIRLAGELLSESFQQTLYILDEPTSGLHPVDVGRLIAVLRDLVDFGHTLVVIEHDAQVIASADWVLNLGPGAGPNGGVVTLAGPGTAFAP